MKKENRKAGNGMCVTGQMMANVRREASRTGHRESSRSQGGHMKAHQEGTVEERPRTSGSSPRALGEGLPGNRGPQGKAHMAGLAWDPQGTASSLYSWAGGGRARKLDQRQKPRLTGSSSWVRTTSRAFLRSQHLVQCLTHNRPSKCRLEG